MTLGGKCERVAYMFSKVATGTSGLETWVDVDVVGRAFCQSHSLSVCYTVKKLERTISQEKTVEQLLHTIM